MKKKYLDGSGLTCLKTYKNAIRYCDKMQGYISQIEIESLNFNLPVDYFGSDQMLLGPGYHCIMFMPDEGNFCLSGIFNEKKEIVEWYIDITDENGFDEGGPYFMDLYLDFAIAPDYSVSFLDEEELESAKAAGEITRTQYEKAYRVSRYVKEQIITNHYLLKDYLLAQIKPF